MAEEEVLFEQDRVRITTAKAQMHGTTYPISGITSVTTLRRSPSTGGPFLLGFAAFVVLGLSFPCMLIARDDPSNGLAAVCSIAGPLSFVALLGVAVFVHLLRESVKWVVLLGTAGGDRQALVTTNEDFANEVRQAIEDAITRRG